MLFPGATQFAVLVERIGSLFKGFLKPGGFSDTLDEKQG